MERLFSELTVDLPNQTTSHRYPIYIGEGLFKPKQTNVLPKLDYRQILVVSNPTVWQLYGDAFMQTLKQHTLQEQIQLHFHLIADGEAYKTWETLNGIFDTLLTHHFDRQCALIALGGGVVGDIAGFAASIYLRGVDIIQVPTTLLSQVDSSVGGKTAINHPLGKNMIGAFWQPKQVWIDSSCLNSLPDRELSAGLAEVLKHGLLADMAYFDEVVENMSSIFERKTDFLGKVIQRSCEIKASIVAKDEREDGIRAHLNLGHTFGHAIELGLGFGKWLHGEAVGCGLMMSSVLSEELGFLSKADVTKIRKGLEKAKLPISPPQTNALDTMRKWISLIMHDKKTKAGQLNFIILERLGKAKTVQIDESPLKKVLEGFGVQN